MGERGSSSTLFSSSGFQKKGRVQSKMSCLEETSMRAVPSPVGDSYAEESNKVDLK